MNIFLFIAGALAFTVAFGRLIQKIQIPWVFSALFLGLVLSLYNPFSEITHSDSFSFLADLGMYFLLFMIGLELDVKEMLKQGKFIAKLSFGMVLAETFFGALFVHFVFSVPWEIAILTASSFATVGEAILIPILDEFKIIRSRFGQTILGVGTLDDIVELLTLVFAAVVLGGTMGHSHMSMSMNFVLFGILFLGPFLLQIFQARVHRLHFQNVPALFLFGLLILFAFVGIGSFVESEALGAILAGIALKNLLSEEKLEQFESIIRVSAYGFLVPIFFLSVGSNVDVHYLASAPFLILLVLFITSVTKILVSLLFAHKRLGAKKSVVLGIGLSAKFSTSIVILTMLYTREIIPPTLYSVLIGAMIVSQFVIPVSFSVLLKKWGLSFQDAVGKKVRKGKV